MLLSTLFDRFVADSPLTVMARALLERLLQAEPLDQLFLQTATQQYNHELLFSSVVELLSRVALRVQPSARQAFLNAPQPPGVSLSAFYQKLNRSEPQLGPALVRYSAAHLQEILTTLQAEAPPWRAGLRVKILDGNHFSGTHHRLKVLRGTAAAALPGQVLAVLDPRTQLFLDLIGCEDAYTQERALLDWVLPQVEANDVWVADRNFCTPRFLHGIAQRQGFFVIREHAQLNIRYEGDLREVGRNGSGRVFEQEAEVTDEATGRALRLRRVLVRLDQPTRDGETEVALLTNLPGEVAAAGAVADLYLQRWTIEVAFGELTTVLRCEVETLSYPRAALLSFAVAALAANVLAGVRGGLRSVYGRVTVEEDLSIYQVAQEIAGTYKGMMIALPAAEWRVWTQMSLLEFTDWLRRLAKNIKWAVLQKSHRGPKKPPVKKPSASKQRHVSTARLLIQAKETKKLTQAGKATPSQG